MKIYMRMIANAEIDLDENSGDVNDLSVSSTKLYSSNDGINWIEMEGSELDQSISKNIKKVIGLLDDAI